MLNILLALLKILNPSISQIVCVLSNILNTKKIKTYISLLLIWVCMFFYPVAWALDTSAPSQSDGLIHTPLTVQKVVRIKNHCATLDLPSNPSTGYDWQVHRYDADVIAHIQKTYKPPQETKGLVGVPGFTRFVFKLHPHVTIHSTDIWVSYSRPWEKPSPPSILRLVG